MKSCNVLTEDNGVLLTSKSSETRGCPASNVLSNNEKRLWISLPGLPQELVFDLSRAKLRPELCKGFGWFCWHSYKSNPALVELWASQDGTRWTQWAEFQAKAESGENLFRIKPLPKMFLFLKVVIRETFGAGNTYMNQVLLYEEFSEVLKSEEQNFELFKGTNFSSFEENVKNLADFENSLMGKGVPIGRPPQMVTKVDEVGKIRKEIKGWARDMENMQKAIENIANQVERIGENVSFRGNRSLIQEIKDELGKTNRSETESLRANVNDRLESVFKSEIERWQKRVLEPDFLMINRMIGASSRSPQEILGRIDEKLRRKAFLIRKKDILQKLAGYKPKRN
jgi:hypothetical protein